MAKFVIAGSSHCPYYAKVELLADSLAKNLPNFKVHKIVICDDEWEGWLKKTCAAHNFRHEKSPVVWRELVERGGKGLLLGGYNEFMEYAQGYYGATSDMRTGLMLLIKEENVAANLEKIQVKERFQSLVQPIHVCIVNASNTVAYHLLPQIASGEVFGHNVDVSVRLYDDNNKQQLEGVGMEVFDLGFPLLRGVKVIDDLTEAFTGANTIIILDNNSSPAHESRDEILKRNAAIYEEYARIIDQVALPDVKVLFSGSGPVNFNAHILIEHATNLSKQNVVVSSTLQERRARSLLAKKLNVNACDVKDVVVWGDCAKNADGATIHVGVGAGRVHRYDGAVWGPAWYSRPLIEIVHDNKWLSTEFVNDAHTRKSAVESSLNHNADMSEAAAISSLLSYWVQGSNSDEIWSLGVESEGWHGVSGCVFSLPVKFSSAGSYQVVWDLVIDDESKMALKKIEAELKKDIQVIFPALSQDPPTGDDQEGQPEVFGEDSQLISGMIQPPSPESLDSPSKTPGGGDKLEAILEEESEEPNSPVPPVKDEAPPAAPLVADTE